MTSAYHCTRPHCIQRTGLESVRATTAGAIDANPVDNPLIPPGGDDAHELREPACAVHAAIDHLCVELPECVSRADGAKADAADCAASGEYLVVQLVHVILVEQDVYRRAAQLRRSARALLCPACRRHAWRSTNRRLQRQWRAPSAGTRWASLPLSFLPPELHRQQPQSLRWRFSPWDCQRPEPGSARSDWYPRAGRRSARCSARLRDIRRRSSR